MSKLEAPRTGRPTTMSTNGMVATSHYLATEAGNYALQQGGSAVDAAIAANAVLCVVYPHMAGLGGDAFWLIWSPNDKRLSALNGSGRAAGNATIDFYHNQGQYEIPSRGPVAANTVPGAVDSWFQAHRRYGRLPWARLFERAIDYAERGAPVPRSTATWLEKDKDILSRHSETGSIFLPGGQVPRLGQLLAQPDLARSLKMLADQGRDVFYEGEIAREIVDHLRQSGGLLSAEDFRSHTSDWVEPIGTDYRGLRVYTFPPNTQGMAMLQIMNLLENVDLGRMGDGSPDYVHTIVEATRLAFADRDRWVTDPRTLQIPMDDLLSKDYARQRWQQFDRSRALRGEDIRPGSVGRGGPGLAGEGPGIRRRPAGDTIYLSVVDQEGGAVSLIQSIYHDFGAAVVGGRTGIILQNRGSFFSLDPNHPNRLEPGKRTFHTLMPSIAMRGDALYLVFGTMGGEGQPQTQAMMLTRLVDFGYDLQQVVEAPRWLFGRAWGEQETTLKLEGRFPRDTADELRRRGHDVEVVDDWAEVMGHAQAVLLDPDTCVLHGAADPRGDGAAMGW